MGSIRSGMKTYSAAPTDYKLLEEIGHGASATVYRAICLPLNEIVAIKCLDLDRCNSNLDDIRREAQTMSLINHPNVIRAYCSFVVERRLWVVMPFMAEGSCLHLMKVAYQDGLEERAIGSILKETLKALEYLHWHGHIHRDVKAGNILLDSNGVVKLGDFGVSACMFDNGDRQRSRNTFVGTPCWMAPEVLQPGSGYDFKADIWSFGITALELAHGHAPFSKYPPMKVLLMTIQNAPPGLDYDQDKRFSKSFKEMVAMCLVKDQTKRPTAEKLLKHSFFKHAKPVELSVKNLFADLPPLWDRVKALQLKDAEQLALKKMPSAEQEALSQSEYKRGVSEWKFDVEDLKAQASLVQDDDDLTGTKDEDETFKESLNGKDTSLSRSWLGKSISANDVNSGWESANPPASDKCKCTAWKTPSFSGPLMLSNRVSSNSVSAPTKPSVGSRDCLEDKSKANVVQIKGRFSITSENLDLVKVSNLKKSASVGDWLADCRRVPNIQQPKEASNNTILASIVVPHLVNLFQQTALQQELIMTVFNSLQQSEVVDAIQKGVEPPAACDLENDTQVETTTSKREQNLLIKISELQARMISLTDELMAAKLNRIKLQQQLNAIYGQEEDWSQRAEEITD